MHKFAIVMRGAKSTKQLDTLWLHIGMDKTGTSAIQHFMQINRSRVLNRTGIWYPSAGQWEDHGHHPFAFSIWDMCGYDPTTLPQLMKSATTEKRRARTILLSSECFFAAPTSKNFHGFAEIARTLFQKIKIVVYLRRQDRWVEARYKQHIISCEYKPLQQLMDERYCNYEPYIDRWADAFGANNVLVRVYERQQQTKQCLLADFLSCFGEELGNDFRIPRDRINVSLGLDQCELRRLATLVNITGPSSHRLNGLLTTHTKSMVSTNSTLLSPRERRALLRRCEPSNRAIAERYLGRAGESLFQEAWPEDEPGSEYQRQSDRISLQTILRYIKAQAPELFRIIHVHAEEACGSDDEIESAAGIELASACGEVDQ